jgi:hypothetical protein
MNATTVERSSEGSLPIATRTCGRYMLMLKFTKNPWLS